MAPKGTRSAICGRTAGEGKRLVMNWLSTYSAALGVIVNAAVLAVLIVYLNIFLASYLRQRRHCVLIT